MEDDEDFLLNKSQVHTLLKFAKVGKQDVFYDLGCGDGLVVCMAVSHGHAKRAIGVEVNRENFELSCRLAVDRLTKKKLKKKVNFWFGHIDNEETLEGELLFDYSDATIAFHSLEEGEEDIEFYQKRFDKKVRIIRKDLPLIGYAPVAVNREDPKCWFFMHKFPLKRIRDKDMWAQLVMGQTDSDIKDVRGYLRNQLEKRNINEEDTESSLRDFNRLARSRFSD